MMIKTNNPVRTSHWLLAFFFLVDGPEARGHTCDPEKITLIAGGPPASWQITADLTEDLTLYTPKTLGDPSVATLSPDQPFTAHNGVFTITPVGSGTTRFEIEWFYEPTGLRSTCSVQVEVKRSCSVRIEGPARGVAGIPVPLQAVLEGSGAGEKSYAWEIIAGNAALQASGDAAIVTAESPGEVAVKVTASGPECPGTVTATQSLSKNCSGSEFP